MKKIILPLLVFYLYSVMNVYAITLGNSIGINLGFLKLKTSLLNSSQQDSNADLGFFYKYNWNVYRVIIGVEFFYDYLNLKNFLENDSINFRYRYGTNFNLGYDITDNFSIYGIVGYGLVKYEEYNEEFNYKVNETKSRPIYGVGTGYSISDTWKIGLEYTIQEMNKKLNSEHHIKNRLESVNFAIIYKF